MDEDEDEERMCKGLVVGVGRMKVSLKEGPSDQSAGSKGRQGARGGQRGCRAQTPQGLLDQFRSSQSNGTFEWLETLGRNRLDWYLATTH